MDEKLQKQREARAARVKQEFGARLRELRKATGQAQDKFALASNLDRSWYAKAERGEISVSLVNLDRIARALGISVSKLLENVGED